MGMKEPISMRLGLMCKGERMNRRKCFKGTMLLLDATSM